MSSPTSSALSVSSPRSARRRYDRVNGSAPSETLHRLDNREGMVGGVYTDGVWDGGQQFTIADWSVIEAAYGAITTTSRLQRSRQLPGAAGDDLFVGGLGSDTFEGGSGDDCVIYEGEFAAYQSPTVSTRRHAV